MRACLYIYVRTEYIHQPSDLIDEEGNTINHRIFFRTLTFRKRITFDLKNRK